jgi:hypothetical protein
MGVDRTDELSLSREETLDPKRITLVRRSQRLVEKMYPPQGFDPQNRVFP